MKRTQWECDRCGVCVLVEHLGKPDGWHRSSVNVTTDLAGFWAADFSGDLCSGCFSDINNGVRFLTAKKDAP